MTTDSFNYRDPALVDRDTVRPGPGLATSFEVAANPDLLLSTKAKVWGDKAPSAIEPTESAYVSEDLKSETLVKDGYRCMYCGFHSRGNQVHNLNDNHRDVSAGNLRAVDPLCHAWQHLGEIGEDGAVIAYLPGLNAQDINHLQRTILIALRADDPLLREDARTLLNWLASHRDYTKDAWGTSDPSVFAEALVRLNEEDREKRAVVFQNLAVVINPIAYDEHVSEWAKDAYRKLPTSGWHQVYHDVINAPA